MKYFIADNNGDIYAHDIQSETQANAILADIVTAFHNGGESVPEGLAVLDEREQE